MKKQFPKKIFIVSYSKILTSALRLCLTVIYNVEIKHCKNEDGFRINKECLKTNKSIPIILLGLDSEECSYWLWNILRAEPDLLNPIVVLGIRAVAELYSTYPVFKGGAGKYHKYLDPPWLLSNLQEMIRNVKPLYDDDVREHFFQKYGQPNLYDRMTRILHDFKGVNMEKDMAVVEHALKLEKLFGDEQLRNLLCTSRDMIMTNNQESARILKAKLLELICKRNTR